MHMNLFFACMYVCVPHACLALGKTGRGVWVPGTGITEDFELACES